MWLLYRSLVVCMYTREKKAYIALIPFLPPPPIDPSYISIYLDGPMCLKHKFCYRTCVSPVRDQKKKKSARIFLKTEWKNSFLPKEKKKTLKAKHILQICILYTPITIPLTPNTSSRPPSAYFLRQIHQSRRRRLNDFQPTSSLSSSIWFFATYINICSTLSLMLNNSCYHICCCCYFFVGRCVFCVTQKYRTKILLHKYALC